MGRRIITVSFFFLLIALLGAHEAFAANRAGALSVYPFRGGYFFEGNQGLKKDSVGLGVGVGYNLDEHWCVEGLFDYINARSLTNGHVNSYLYKADAFYNFMPSSSLVPYVAAGLGGVTINKAGGKSGTSLEFDYGAGLRYYLSESLAVGLDLRHLISFNDTHSNFLYNVGISYSFGGAKRPDIEKTEAHYEIPVVVVEPDNKEAIAEKTEGVMEKPVQAAPVVVTAAREAEPLEPAGLAVKKQAVAVPEYRPANTAPQEPERLEEPPIVVERAKPAKAAAAPDSDEDGIPDDIDEFPETPGGFFDFDDAHIKPVYERYIKAVAEKILADPGAKGFIEGHTDSRGSDAYNMRLSIKRAKSAKRDLVRKFGIDPGRLKTKGYGEKKPIADNSTDEGRSKNRRVEVRIVVTR